MTNAADRPHGQKTFKIGPNKRPTKNYQRKTPRKNEQR